MLSIPTSVEHARLKLGTDAPRRIMALARAAISAAKDLGMQVTFSAEDGARTDPGFLAEYVANGADAGADRFRIAETVSTLRPRDCGDLVGRLASVAGKTEIEMHCHNMFGLGVANSLAALEAGARWISTTVGGLGERGGNTPLAEVVCALRVFHSVERFQLGFLTPLTNRWADWAVDLCV
jgi:homocitrate synthase NifV